MQTNMRRIERNWQSILAVKLAIIVVAAVSVVAINSSSLYAKQQTNVNYSDLVFNTMESSISSSSRENLITLEVHDQPLSIALQMLAEKATVGLSYNSAIIPDKNVDIVIRDAQIGDVLYKLLEGTSLEPILPPTKDVIVIRERENKIETLLQETVTGQVTDAETGEPLPGVNIVVEGTTIGTSTDIDGRYNINVSSLSNNVLLYSYIGYQTILEPIENRSEIDVALQSIELIGEELVVVGYGTQRRDEVTGSVSTIRGVDIANQPSVQTSASLMGRIPGVQVAQSSGEPGQSGGTIRIRGIGTLSDSNPLVLIDGVEGSMNNVASTDIESVTVLKDAASASIYGSRAANGVILVTTKRGQVDGMRVNYRVFGGWQTPTNLPEYTDGGTFMRLQNEGAANLGNSLIWSESYIQEWEANYRTDPDHYPNTDWVGEVFSEPGFQQQHSLDITGGSESIRYRGALSYDDENGNIPNFKFQRFALRLNTDINLSDKLDFNFDVNLQRSDRTRPSASFNRIFEDAFRVPPVFAGIYSHGGYGPGWNNFNPIAYANDGGLQEHKGYDLRGKFGSTYQPIDNLQLSLIYSADYGNNFNRNMTKRFQISDPNNREVVVAIAPNQNRLGQAYTTNFRNTINFTGNYLLQINNHSISVLGGYEYIDYRYDSMNASRTDFPLQDFTQLNAGSAANQQNSGTASEWALQSYFGRVNYDYNSKYLVEANIRLDGSSRFTEANRWGVFPSFSAGWMISEESFMDQIDFITSFKLRGSWGRLGNQQIGTYPFASVINLGQNFIIGDNPVDGAAQQSLANPQISWETTTSSNIGIDLSFLDDKIFFNLDYFERETSDILLQLPIPLIIGLGAPYQNAGVVENIGWEAIIGYNGFIGNDFSFSTSFNISDVNNKVLDLHDTGPFISGHSITKEGYPIGAIYGWESDGLFRDQNDVDGHARQSGNIAPGDIKYVDQNNDGVINDQDRVIIGDPFASLSFGLDLSIAFKNLSISAFFQGVGSRDVILQGDAVWAMYNGGKIRKWQAEDYWSPDNLDAQTPRFTPTTTHNNFTASDYWVYDGSYLRLRNLHIGYSLPNTITDRLSLQDVSIFFIGQNLFTLFNKMPPGIDPNVPNGSRGANYPVTRLLSAGIELRF